MILATLAALGAIAAVSRRGRLRAADAGVTTCTPLPATSPGATSAWLASRPPLSRLHFRIYWNDYFQVHEIVFRNAFDRPIRFDVSTAIGTAQATHPLRRSLRAGEQEVPPSTSVASSTGGAPVCIHVRHVRLGDEAEFHP